MSSPNGTSLREPTTTLSSTVVVVRDAATTAGPDVDVGFVGEKQRSIVCQFMQILLLLIG